jgi:hypothetical protein
MFSHSFFSSAYYAPTYYGPAVSAGTDHSGGHSYAAFYSLEELNRLAREQGLTVNRGEPHPELNWPRRERERAEALSADDEDVLLLMLA